MMEEKKEVKPKDVTIDISKETDVTKLESMAYKLIKEINRCQAGLNNIELRIRQIKGNA